LRLPVILTSLKKIWTQINADFLDFGPMTKMIKQSLGHNSEIRRNSVKRSLPDFVFHN